MRLGARSTQRLTNQLRLALEPECLENPTATAREIPRDGADSIRDTQTVCGFRCWASKHAPLFHTINTMVAIFLAKVSRAISGRMPLVNQILQIVITVSVESANGDLFLRSLQLPIDLTMIGTAMCLDGKSAVGPQLPLGAETVRGLQNAK